MTLQENGFFLRLATGLAGPLWPTDEQISHTMFCWYRSLRPFARSQMKEVQVALHLKLSILFSHSTREISKDIRDEGNNKRYSWSKRLNKPPYSSCCRWWRETQPLYTSVAVLRQCWFTDFDSLTTMMSSGHALCGCPMGTANCSSCYTGSLLLGSRIGAQESSLRQKSSLNCLSKSFSWRLKR